VAIRDRDTLGESEIAGLTATISGLYIWRTRSIENEILNAPLIARALERTGRHTTVGCVESELRARADEDFDWVVADAARLELERRHHYARPAADTPIELARQSLAASARAASARSGDFDTLLAEMEPEIRSRWTSDWSILMNGKRVMGRFVSAHTPFSSTGDVIAALAAACRDDDAIVPAAFRDLRARLITAIERSGDVQRTD
jgi:hypothetical protein